jgi:hypothetical protein
MAGAGSLLFLLAPAEALSADRLATADLQQVQSRGVSSAFALRIVVTRDLEGRFQRVCDAITPRFETERLWLGVYRPAAHDPAGCQRIDHFPLHAARNDTCWFYPTHNGHYLSWQRNLVATLGPGTLAEPCSEQPEHYSRDRVALLWSLLADQTSLTCVGLTYAGRRIDWPLEQRQWAGSATWSEFSVDCLRDQPLIVHSTRVVDADTHPPHQL